MDRALAIVPLSARGFAALYEIATEPEPESGGTPLTQRALAARLGLGASTVSELLARLRRRGLVRGTTVTEAGRAALAHAERVATRLEDDWSRRLDAAAGSAVPGLRRQGLRRWLAESRAALASAGRPPCRRQERRAPARKQPS
ncbi:MAG: MarR family transcriptional regulator [Gemmatimonadales bacterium]